MASPAGNRVNGLALIFTLVSGVVVFLRLFTRYIVIRSAGFEDICIALAMFFSIGLTVAISVQVQRGMGKHIYELTQTEMVESQKAFWASIWIYYLSLAFTKISILVQYLRIFPTRRFRIVCFVMLGIVSLYAVWGLFGSVFLCYPVRFFWDKSVPGGKCLDQFAVWFSNASMNIAQDFLILLLPMPVLRRLDIPRRQKKVLMVVFALGGVVCIISVVRLQTLVAISNSTDPTFDNPPAASLSSVETNVSIIIACLPSLRPLLSAMMPNHFPPTGSTTASQLRTYNEEHAQLKHQNKTTISTSSRPPTASPTVKGSFSHSRSLSGATYDGKEESELGDLSGFQSAPAAPATTGIRVIGPVRQVHIRSPSAATLLTGTPKLPGLLDDVSSTGDVEVSGKEAWRFRSAASNPLSGQRTPRTPVVQKPLPITPFPVMPV